MKTIVIEDSREQPLSCASSMATCQLTPDLTLEVELTNGGSEDSKHLEGGFYRLSLGLVEGFTDKLCNL